MSFKEKIQHKYALSEQGAKDMIKAFVSVTISDIVLMFPVGMLYFLVKDYMGGTLGGRGGLYLAGSLICLALIAITTYIQYFSQFFRECDASDTTLHISCKKCCIILDKKIKAVEKHAIVTELGMAVFVASAQMI